MEACCHRLFFFWCNNKGNWRCPVPVLLLLKGLIFTIWVVLGEQRMREGPGLYSPCRTTKRGAGPGDGREKVCFPPWPV